MSNNPYNESKFAHFASGKGFYVILTACLLGLGAATAVSLTEEKNMQKAAEQEKKPSTVVKQKEEPKQGPEILEQALEKETEKANKEQKDVPIEKEESKEAEQKEPVAASAVTTVGVMPCDGNLVNGFSNGELVKDETMGDWRTHNGIDIGAAEGSAVKASAAGKIKAIRNDALWGTVVEIEHSGAVVTKYCGLDKELKVAQGDTVKAGDVIGKTAAIPAEGKAEPHLHFELMRQGKYIDPMTFIK